MNQARHSKNTGIGMLSRRTTLTVLLLLFSCFIFLLETSSCSTGTQQGQENIADTSTTAIADLMTEEHVWTAPDTSTIPGG